MTSAMGLPMSSVSSTASDSAFSSISAAKRFMTSMRARGAIFDQTPDLNALRAACTARSMSSAVPADISAMASPVAGLMLVKRPPFFASTNLPSMKSRVSSFFCALDATVCQRLRSWSASAWMLIGLPSCLVSGLCAARGTTSASTMAQPSACTITGFRSISASWSPSAAARAEKRAATRQNSSRASGCRCRRLWSRGAMRRRFDEPRGLRGVERRHGIHRVRECLDVHAAGADQHDRAELLVVDHAEQHFDAFRRDHRRHQHARSMRFARSR